VKQGRDHGVTDGGGALGGGMNGICTPSSPCWGGGEGL
jgi:hypothetical protein